MSYKNYSEEAVKEIMTKVMKSQKRDVSNDYQSSRGLTLDELIKIGAETGIDSDKIRKATYEYDHPITVKSDGISSTHAFIEKTFESEHNEDSIWDEILNVLGHYVVDDTSGKTKLHPSKKMWTHVDHANHETVVSLTKTGKTANLQISQRVGFFSPPIQGVLHGAYTSFILFGFIFAIFNPSLILSIGILATLWTLIGIIIFKLNKVSRRKKLVRLKKLADQLTDRFSNSKVLKDDDPLQVDNQYGSSESSTETKSRTKTNL